MSEYVVLDPNHIRVRYPTMTAWFKSRRSDDWIIFMMWNREEYSDPLLQLFHKEDTDYVKYGQCRRKANGGLSSWMKSALIRRYRRRDLGFDVPSVWRDIMAEVIEQILALEERAGSWVLLCQQYNGAEVLHAAGTSASDPPPGWPEWLTQISKDVAPRYRRCIDEHGNISHKVDENGERILICMARMSVCEPELVSLCEDVCATCLERACCDIPCSRIDRVQIMPFVIAASKRTPMNESEKKWQVRVSGMRIGKYKEVTDAEEERTTVV